jgi:hypothetical protein
MVGLVIITIMKSEDRKSERKEKAKERAQE